MTTTEIAALVQGEVVGDGSVEIVRVAKIEEAGPGDLTFLANPKYEKFLSTTNASAILISTMLDTGRHRNRATPVFIKVQDPYVAFLRALKTLTPVVDPFPTDIHPTTVVAPSASIGKNVALGPYVVVGRNAVIGENSRISAGCVIGDEAVVGSECLFYPNVTIYHQCRVGARVIVHAGAVIGSDGFGFAPRSDGRYEKIPQLGIVRIEEDVEIGSNCSIDRATIGETIVKRGVKLDNMVHIAHNVVVGEDTVIAAQVGVSGSSKIGKNSMIGGQVGIGGHLEIADRSIVLGQAGVSKSLTEPGKAYFGTPAKEQRKAQRMEAALRSLPELIYEMRDLQQKVETLRKKFEEKNS